MLLEHIFPFDSLTAISAYALTPLFGTKFVGDGQDLTGYAASPLGGEWSASLTGGLNRQTAQDRDDDGYADITGYRRATVRPRLFWTGEGGAKTLLTAGYLTEDRAGGTLKGAVLSDGRPYRETQKT